MLRFFCVEICINTLKIATPKVKKEKMNKVKNSETVEPFSVDQTVISLLQMILLNRKK